MNRNLHKHLYFQNSKPYAPGRLRTKLALWCEELVMTEYTRCCQDYTVLILEIKARFNETNGTKNEEMVP